MLKLIVGNSENHEPVIPVRWCLSKDLVEELAEAGAINPYILLSVYRGGMEIDRIVVPLEQTMTFVELNHPGENRIEARIIWFKEWAVWRFIKARERGRYTWSPDFVSFKKGERVATGMMGVEGSGATIGLFIRTEKASAKVFVDKEFFAKEPPAWEKRWVNFWFGQAPRDQCEYRRRRIVAYTIQPIALLAWATFMVLLRVVWGTGLLLTGARTRLSPILHPFRDEVRDMRPYPPRKGEWVEEDRFFSYDEDCNERSFGFWLLHPLNWVVAGGILIAIYQVPLDYYLTLRILTQGLVLIATIGIVGKLMGDWWMGRRNSTEARQARRLREEERKRKLEREAKEWALNFYRERLADTTCSAGDQRPTLSALQRPSAVLRFQALKAKVCRPYRL